VNDDLADLLGLSDFAWQRHRDRMASLTDEEYNWEPVPNCRTVRPVGDGTFRSDGHAEPDEAGHDFSTLSWRLSHIAALLAEDRNAVWLGRPPTAAQQPGDPGTAADALAALDAGYANWRAVLAGSTSESLTQPIGPVGGRFAQETRRAFVLHILDELIHHAAEAALLRDLYAAQP
jgi:uncharacterized damage-inducible protein DinB